MLRDKTMYVISGLTSKGKSVPPSSPFDTLLLIPYGIPMRTFANKCTRDYTYESLSVSRKIKPFDLATKQGILKVAVTDWEGFRANFDKYSINTGNIIEFANMCQGLSGHYKLEMKLVDVEGRKLLDLTPYISVNTGWDSALYDEEIRWHHSPRLTSFNSLENTEAVDS